MPRYSYTNREANFGKPLKSEVKGGTHLTLEVVLERGRNIVALRRPHGLHDGPKNALYFPHGLMRFGETVEQCVERLVREQAGVGTVGAKVHSLDSWVDENQHWHLALNVVALIQEQPAPSQEVSEIIEFSRAEIPEDLAWWSPKEMAELFAEVRARSPEAD